MSSSKLTEIAASSMNNRIADLSLGRYIYLCMPKANLKSFPARSRIRKASRQPRSYTPLSDALSQPLTFADTELSQGIQRHSLAGLLGAAISRQRRSDGGPLPKGFAPCWSGL